MPKRSCTADSIFVCRTNYAIAELNKCLFSKLIDSCRMCALRGTTRNHNRFELTHPINSKAQICLLIYCHLDGAKALLSHGTVKIQLLYNICCEFRVCVRISCYASNNQCPDARYSIKEMSVASHSL